MEARTYLGHLQNIAHDPEAITKEIGKLGVVKQELLTHVRKLITPETASSLVFMLALMEIRRVQPLVGIPISNFASQARFLRAIAASVSFSKFNPNVDTEVDTLLDLCEQLWHVLFYLEILDDAQSTREVKDNKRKRHATEMRLIGTMQLEMKYGDQADGRVSSIFGRFCKDIILPRTGLTVESAIQGFKYIRKSVADRFNTALKLMLPFHSKFKLYEKVVENGASKRKLDKMFRKSKSMKEAGICFTKGMDMYRDILIFTEDDMRCLGTYARPFLDYFSFTPGGVNQKYEMPADNDIVRLKPFAKLADDKYMLFDIYYSSMSPLYAFPELFTTESEKLRLNKERDNMLERNALDLLRVHIKPEIYASEYYIPIRSDGSRAERDMLFFRDGVLIVVECKAKPLRSISGHRGNLRKIESDIKATIQAGYDQAVSVVKYIDGSATEVVLYNDDGQSTNGSVNITKSDIKEVLTIIVLDSYYGVLATDLEPWLVVSERAGYPWVIDQDTLHPILIAFEPSACLVPYLRWRKSVHGRMHSEDEAAFAGFFLRHGDTPLPGDDATVILNPEYTDVIEASYFKRKGYEFDEPPQGSNLPVFSTMQRIGDKLVMEIDGEQFDTIRL